MIHPVSGPLVFQPYGKDDTEALHSVSRGGLNKLLVEAATENPNVRMFFDHRCAEVSVGTNDIDFETPAGMQRISAHCIIGADGAFSAVRTSMQKLDRFDYSQEYLTHGYKELCIPPGDDGNWRMEPNALHIWPRGDFMMIALPNADRSFTCTLFWPHEGPHGFSRLTTEGEVREYFLKEFPDAVPSIPDLPTAYLNNVVGSLVTVRCQPWHFGAKAVLVGDACHAVVPFLGQGMNAAFEDCSVLVECLQSNTDRQAAFAEYQKRRKVNADVLADLCIDNFIEMRDRVGSPWFVLKKRTQILLHKLFPKWYLPLYTMIEFTRIPYSEAKIRAGRQNKLMLMAGVGLLLALALLVFIATSVFAPMPVK
jgi:kynurenine 3-monooxygenase